MAPLTRSSAKRGPVLWFGEADADQDLCIRLVRKRGDDDHTLALLMVHSSRLEKYSTYFSARLSERWGSKRKRDPEEIPLHVLGDVELYKDCFSRMYNPLQVAYESVRYSLELLKVATHLAYDDLMSSICEYLASICPWTCHEEMRIRKAVSSGDFPCGHAKDLLERLEGCLTRDDLRSLVKSCMKSLYDLRYAVRWPKEARELLTYVMETAKVQERGHIPTFEQDIATILKEEFNLVLVKANDEALKINGSSEVADASRRGLTKKLVPVVAVLEILLTTGTATDVVKSFVMYKSIATFLDRKVIGTESLQEFRTLVDDLACTLVTILKEVLAGNLHLEDSHRHALLINWVPLLERLYLGEVNLVDANERMRFVKEYSDVRVHTYLSPLFSGGCSYKE